MQKQDKVNEKMIKKSFHTGSNFRKAQCIKRNGIPNEGSVYKERVSVSIGSSQRDYTERILPNVEIIQ